MTLNKFFILLLIIVTQNSFTQNIYLSGNFNGLYSLNSDDTLNFHSIINGTSIVLSDIAFLENNLYGINLYGDVFEIEIETGNTSMITSFPDSGYTSLAGNNQNELYTININNFNLYKFNLITGIIELVSNLGYGTPGDLAFYKGNLIFPPIASSTDAELKAYNNGVIYDIYCANTFISPIYGIANDCQSCENGNEVIVATPSSLYKIDFDTETAIYIPVNGNLYDSEFWGLASNNEFNASNCNITLEDKDCDCPYPNEDTISPIPQLNELPILTEQCIIEQITQPIAYDNCDGNILGNTTTTLPITSSTEIIWVFTDNNGNTSTQNQQVIIEDTISPIPQLNELPILSKQCIIEQITQPIADDNCDGNILGNTTTTLPITSSTEIIWVFTDDNGNTSTQNQQVIIEDTISPISQLNELPILTEQCIIEQITQPIADDNCDGNILANTTTTLPITSSTEIIWIFTDNNGNTSTQNQQVIIEDTISPIPHLNELPILTEQCIIEQITQPIADDNCDGNILGNTTTTLPITSSTEIIWIFTDNNGNISTQNQQVIIDCSAHEINIYPNPFNKKINLTTNGNILSIYLYDINGKIIYEILDDVIEINTRELSSGMYLLKIKTSTSFKIFKMIKQ